MNSVDKIIDNLCSWVERQIETEQTTENLVAISNMVHALAALVAARAMTV